MAIRSEAFPRPMIVCQLHLPRPEKYLSEAVLLPVKLPVERDDVPPY